MSKPKRQDPEVRAKKAERRKRRQAAIAEGHVMLPPQTKRRSGLTDHGSSPQKRRRAREGEAMMQRERGDDQ